MRPFFIGVICIVTTAAAAMAAERHSAFYPPTLLERIRANSQRDEWGKSIKQRAVDAAEPWKNMSDEQLWKLMFGATIPRSWHVWSNGFCPACKTPVPMYDWQIDAIDRPWKVRCPHCQELFPKNDFAKFHESGLDEHGVFDPAQADKSLLFNAEHPHANDPKHKFGVDDGTGYVEGSNRWRFIPTYLVYGQWKGAVHLGITRLATAYVMTGDPVYAHKAAILLDRVADVYPAFDFKSQGILYESARGDGYVSVWHDATIETREMALTYDAIKGAIAGDAALVKFLAEKSEKFKTPTPKKTADDIAANIETRILRDAVANQHKIYSNYPQQFLTVAVINTALNWPANRADVLKALDPIIEQSTAVDGTTGEKGLAGYSSYAAQRLAEFLGYYARMDDKFLAEMIQRHPRLPQFYRFFIDTWCANGNYYPLIGDTGWFAASMKTYSGMTFDKYHFLAEGTVKSHSLGVLTPSPYALLWQLYEQTKDPAFAQVMYRANDNKLDGLPFDITAKDPAELQAALAGVIKEHGADIKLGDVNKQQWHLAILRSGHGPSERAAWLAYDVGGGHGHQNGMNLGLFALGLDLMPDFGYPLVQFGGWDSPRAQWYKSTFAHNTVVVDGREQTFGAVGATKYWSASESGFSAITASGETMYGIKTYQRSVAMVDTSERDSYVVDIFRVAGGSDHAKFFLTHFGSVTPSADLKLQTADDFKHAQMRNWKAARNAAPPWAMTWDIEDRYKLLPENEAKDLHLRYTDLTNGADAYLGEAWIVPGIYNQSEGAWQPRVMTRRRSAGGKDLKSTFVSIIEPYRGSPLIKKVMRSGDEETVVLEVERSDGQIDRIEAAADGTVSLQRRQ